jgi:hypothetical protein
MMPPLTFFGADAASAPQLSLLAYSDDGARIWLNKEQIFDDRLVYGPGYWDPKKIPLSLHAGWNHILVKIGQLDGRWAFAARFESSDPSLLAKLRASALQWQ